MKAFRYILALVIIVILAVPALTASGVDDSEPEPGELYGDLYVILRGVGGVPILDKNDCIQPISSVTDSVTIETDDGDLVIDAIEGQPFFLPYYTLDEDLVACELTEEMADWVQTVDFGRLNLGRAPQFVIDHAFDEAINKLNSANTITFDPSGRLVLTSGDGEKTIDSPAENLSLYIKMMIDGHWITENTDATVIGGPPPGKGPPEGDGPSTEPRPVLSPEAIALLPAEYVGLGDDTRTTGEELTSEELLLAASLLAAAADKFGSITLDMIVYINFIYGINQAGTLPGVNEGETYFNFVALTEEGENSEYSRVETFEARQSGECDLGYIWVIQPAVDMEEGYFFNTCMEILGYDPDNTDPSTYVNAVHFTDMVEEYDEPYSTYNFTENVRGFTQAADDALQTLEYTHNYKVPEELYPVP